MRKKPVLPLRGESLVNSAPLPADEGNDSAPSRNGKGSVSRVCKTGGEMSFRIADAVLINNGEKKSK